MVLDDSAVCDGCRLTLLSDADGPDLDHRPLVGVVSADVAEGGGR